MHDFGPEINAKIALLITANSHANCTALTREELIRILIPMLEPSCTEFTTITAISTELLKILPNIPNRVQIGLALQSMGLKSKCVKVNGKTQRVYKGIALKKGDTWNLTNP